MKNERMAVQDDREKTRSWERFAGAGSAPAFYIPAFYIPAFGPRRRFRLPAWFYFPTQKWLKISATTSSLTSRPFV